MKKNAAKILDRLKMLGQSSKFNGDFVNCKPDMFHMLIQGSRNGEKAFNFFSIWIVLRFKRVLFCIIYALQSDSENSSSFLFFFRSIGRRVQGAVDCQRKKRSQADHGRECDEEVRT